MRDDAQALKLKRLALGATLLVVICAAWVLRQPRARAMMRYAREPAELTMPVAGVTRDQVSSSWGEARSGHRRHEGIDIFAPRGTRVLSASDGEVIRVGENRLGGNVVGVAGDGARYYYYAHLARFRPGLRTGEEVKAGDLLGFVGTTGNAAHTSPHLHFGIYPAWNAFRAIDPAPLLKARIARRTARG